MCCARGTSVAAKHLWRNDLGQIRAGATADLAIMDRDPTADITNVGSITHVVRGGMLYESARLLAPVSGA